MSTRRTLTAGLCLLVLAVALSGAATAQVGGIYRATFANGTWFLTVELLDDDLAHVQFSTEAGEDIPVTPMIARTGYPGPGEVTAPEPGVLETSALRLAVAAESLCLTVTDLTAALTLTMLCPVSGEDSYTLTLTQAGTTDLYGLGEMFQRRGGTEGNWMGRRRLVLNPYGNELTSFNGGNVGNAQFPILYALGAGSDNYAFFLDDVYQQYWDFSSDPWQVTTTADALRGYIMTGPDLPDLRRDYLELTGHPPVPPRQMFGLWVSEFGYENWGELSGVLDSLLEAGFPLDGFVLDLQWFGGIRAGDSQIGSLSWDEANFPDPAGFMTALREVYGLGIMTIEESYVSDTLPDYADLAAAGVLVRQCGEEACEPIHFNTWWGSGGMVDWSNPQAAQWWHDNRRQHLVAEGVTGHWTDLGEPENYDLAAWYYGFPARDLHGEADVHNVYNLLWAASIWDGYARNGAEQRPFILSRSGTAGI
ncbi:MAG: glycoside hydrolase family 31, partial [Anaerolineae bacterium]|nr:glycoside hydrolase family 31 [Anaerolineae bacterium]